MSIWSPSVLDSPFASPALHVCLSWTRRGLVILRIFVCRVRLDQEIVYREKDYLDCMSWFPTNGQNLRTNYALVCQLAICSCLGRIQSYHLGGNVYKPNLCVELDWDNILVGIQGGISDIKDVCSTLVWSIWWAWERSLEMVRIFPNIFKPNSIDIRVIDVKDFVQDAAVPRVCHWYP
jgi:hypothetical protein